MTLPFNAPSRISRSLFLRSRTMSFKSNWKVGKMTDLFNIRFLPHLVFSFATARQEVLPMRVLFTKKESGYSLVIVLMISLVMVMFLTAVSTQVLSEAKSTDRQAQKKQAYYLAEEGVERFISSLYDAAKGSGCPNDQSSLDAWVSTLGLPWSEANPAGSIAIQAVFKNNGIVELKSIGTLTNSHIHQEIDVTIQLSTLPKIFTYALGFGEEFEVAGNPDLTLNGSFYINGEAKLKHDLTIQNGVIDLGPDAGVKEADLKGYTVNYLQAAIDMPSYQQLYDLLENQAVVVKNETVRLSELLTQPKKIVFF